MRVNFEEDWVFFVAALFLVGALGTWPYSYFQILRWIVCAAGIYGTFTAHELKRTGWTWVFGIVAVLFNPIWPFYMQRETWQMLDLLTVIPFVVFPFTKQKHD